MCINVQTNVDQPMYNAILAELEDNVYCDAIYYDHFGYDSYHFWSKYLS